MAILTREDFMKVVQYQADILYERGAKIPKELVVNESLKAELNISDTIILRYVGEIPVIADKDTITCMFRGFIDAQLNINKEVIIPTIDIMPVQKSEYRSTAVENFSYDVSNPDANEVTPIESSGEELPPEDPLPKVSAVSVPPSKRQKAVRRS